MITTHAADLPEPDPRLLQRPPWAGRSVDVTSPLKRQVLAGHVSSSVIAHTGN
jgi:hypothetical protein